MNTQFYGYRSAESEALRLSRENPTTTYYVNWIEENEWCIGTHAELPDQPGYLNGQLTYPESDDSGFAVITHTYDARR